MGGVYKKNPKNLGYEKKNLLENENFFFEKSIFCKFFKANYIFFMPNLHLECFQLSFDIHIVHVDKKL